MAVQILVFEGARSVYESTPPTPDHTPANGVEPVLKVRVMKMGFQAAISHKGVLKKIIWGKFLGNGVVRAAGSSAAIGTRLYLERFGLAPKGLL